MFKFFNNDSEWDIFQYVVQSPKQIVYGKSFEERKLFEKIRNAKWIDNTNTRPDFISEDIMIEMFEIDDIVTTKKGKSNPQRKANARVLREVEEWLSQFPKETFIDAPLIIAQGDTRYNPETEDFTPDDSISHHNYQAYLNNFKRICNKHLKSIDAYRKNHPNKQLGFLIVDDSTYYASKKFLNNRVTTKQEFLNFPFFDKNFMKLFVGSDVDFVIWAFNNKYFYTTEDPHGQNSAFPKIVLISKDNYYTKYSKNFDISSMFSLEE